MCGIVGIVANYEVNQELFDALTVLQHRGQDAAGIASCDIHDKVHLVKGAGLVRDVIRTRHMYRLPGHMGIGHVRYPTAGTDSAEEAQPFYVNSPYGIALAHNGNLTNVTSLKDTIVANDLRHLNTASDSEVLLNVLAHELQILHKVTLEPEDIFTAIRALHQRCLGSYAVVALVAGKGIIAFRDPNGIRPLIYGKRVTTAGTDYMVASESVALDIGGFTTLADVAPGEAIFIATDGKLYRKQCAVKFQYAPCLFEYVYLARPDSIIDKISVYKVRLCLGDTLAQKIKHLWPHYNIDVVMPIPDTSRTAAAVLARTLGLTFREGFVKNRYIGRTFIMPGQHLRRKSVRQKLNTIPLEFQGKDVLLVDDSIVRGTTAKEIIQMARDAGALKVYFASAAPAVKFPNVYGIDMPSAKELIAHNRDTSAICQEIGADDLIFQDLQALYDACYQNNPQIEHFEDSVFSGHYLTQDIDEAYLATLDHSRGEDTSN